MTGIPTSVKRRFPDEILYTTSEAAKEVGRSADTLRRWDRTDGPSPSRLEPMGKTMVRLYTLEDITTMREYGKTQRPGRKTDGETRTK